jgi:hypothetical protein
MLATLLVCIALQSQPQSNTGSIYSVGIFPSHPTIHDSVEVPLKLVFANSPATKWVGDLVIYSDTILYQGCYYCGCVNLATSFVLDTIKIHPLAAGVYHLIILARYPSSFQDTLCLNSNAAYTDTVDSILTISPANAIEVNSNIPLQAVLQGFNVLQINTPTGGTLNISVYDELGRQVYRNNDQILHEGANSVKLQMQTLSLGIYFYHIKVGDQEKMMKFVRQ